MRCPGSRRCVACSPLSSSMRCPGSCQWRDAFALSIGPSLCYLFLSVSSSIRCCFFRLPLRPLCRLRRELAALLCSSEFKLLSSLREVCASFRASSHRGRVVTSWQQLHSRASSASPCLLRCPHHLQGALHSTVRPHALPKGRRCEGDGPFARPGLCEGQAWWRGVTGVGSAGVQMQEHEGVSFCVVPRKLGSPIVHLRSRFVLMSRAVKVFIRSRVPPSSVGVYLDLGLPHVIDVLLSSHSGHTRGPHASSPQAPRTWRARFSAC